MICAARYMCNSNARPKKVVLLRTVGNVFPSFGIPPLLRPSRPVHDFFPLRLMLCFEQDRQRLMESGSYGSSDVTHKIHEARKAFRREMRREVGGDLDLA